MALEALFGVYPEAGIIITHRDPLKVLGSCASFSEVLRSPFTDCFDREKLGLEVTRRWEKGAHLGIQFRRSHPDLERRFIDVYYADLVRDPMAVVRRIYDHFEMTLTDDAENLMLQLLASNPQNKNGVHRYSLETFGLHRDAERRRFQFYTDYYGIDPEG